MEACHVMEVLLFVDDMVLLTDRLENNLKAMSLFLIAPLVNLQH